jgi:hypothetical protein
MKKWGLYAVLFLGVALLGVRGTKGEDVGKLQPVQLIAVEYTEEKVLLRTDTGHEGRGKNVDQALADLESAAYGKVFLDTADYLLIRKNALPVVNALSSHLRPSCALCRFTGEVELADAAKFLQYHIPELTLGKYQAEEQEIPILVSREGRMELVQ